MTQTGTGRTSKTFRAAGDRIVRQESKASSVITRLLGSPQAAAGDPATDADSWEVYLTACATLGQLDGLALIPSGTAIPAQAYNVAVDCAAYPPIDEAVGVAMAGGGQVAQVRTEVPLRDGRTAAAVLVAPVVAGSGVVGVLIGARVGRSFGVADVVSASSIGTLLALELARAAATERESRDRRDALVLYELARLATFAPAGRGSLQDTVAMLGDRLAHEVVQLWVLRPSGSLELRAAVPPGGVPLEIARPFDHPALGEALRARHVIRVADAKPRFWVPGGAQQLLIVPLSSDDRPAGLLVFGRVREPYTLADEDMAGVVGNFLGGTVARARSTAVREYGSAMASSSRSGSSG